MPHLFVRAGLVLSLVGGIVAAGAGPASADDVTDIVLSPITYAWCYDIKTPHPAYAVVTVCSPI